jgi:hypothetical protein
MKKRINIMLSEEALATADESGNRSEYIENLILETSQGTARSLEVVPLHQLTEVLGTLLEEIKNNQISGAPLENKNPKNTIGSATPNSDTFVPKPPDPTTGYPCCLGRSPCKHWVWDDMDTQWKNTITGATRDE